MVIRGLHRRLSPKGLVQSAMNTVRRYRGRAVAKKLANVAFDRPLVSFTFDDIPHDSVNGGAMLARAGCAGTFYLSFGLKDKMYELGSGFFTSDVEVLHEQGHEIGCHTFGHLNAWHITPERFTLSLNRNIAALAEILPGYLLRSFSYPFGSVTPGVKRIAGSRFESCRGIEWGVNAGTVDLNLLRANPLYTAAAEQPAFAELLDETVRTNGWLIFYTHDVADRPTPYGCSTTQFGSLIEQVLSSGARVMRVADVAALIACGETAG